MRRLENKHAEAEDAVEAVNLELAMQTEDVNKVAFNPSDRTCVTTSAGSEAVAAQYPETTVRARDLKPRGSFVTTSGSIAQWVGDGERVVALTRVETGSYNLALFHLIRGRLEYGGSKQGIFAASMKRRIQRHGRCDRRRVREAHMHQHIQVGRSMTYFAYSRNGKAVDWSLRVTNPGSVIFETVAARQKKI